MTETTTTWTVWSRPRYTSNTEVWTGGDFAKAVQVALDQVGTDTLVPLDPNAVVALRSAGKPVAVWLATDIEGDERIIFITR